MWNPPFLVNVSKILFQKWTFDSYSPPPPRRRKRRRRRRRIRPKRIQIVAGQFQSSLETPAESLTQLFPCSMEHIRCAPIFNRIWDKMENILLCHFDVRGRIRVIIMPGVHFCSLKDLKLKFSSRLLNCNSNFYL